MIKERPIIFSTEMVKAILEGRKTQTRRVIKPQPIFKRELNGIGYAAKRWSTNDAQEWGLWLEAWPTLGKWGLASSLHKCPYGQECDKLWVRETWQLIEVFEDWWYGGFEGQTWRGKISTSKPNDCAIGYLADTYDDGPWRPSIHMPRWASRITLEITDVRVERVQDISEKDAFDEGCLPSETLIPYELAIDHFRELWDSINAKRGYGWDVNPWVWVIEFRRL